MGILPLPLLSFFHTKLETWKNTSIASGMESKASWFMHIRHHFREYFEQSVRCLVSIINEINKGVVEIRKESFFLCNGIVKVFPFPPREGVEGIGINLDDIQDYFVNIISLPFLDPETGRPSQSPLYDSDFGLPSDLAYCLYCLSNEHLNFLDVKFILGFGCFWTSEEAYNAIDRLHEWNKRCYPSTKGQFEDWMRWAFYHFNTDWKVNVGSDLVMGEILKFSQYPYDRFCDVIRFGVNAHEHYIDRPYVVRQKTQFMRGPLPNRIQIQDELQALMPYLNMLLYMAIFEWAKHRHNFESW
ncbi:hypothetical protein PTKIN_Ptkin13bG0027500 [Pterospermum kingtungense]